MIGIYETEFINLKPSSCGVVFECTLLLPTEEHEEIDCCHWKMNYNMFDHNKSLTSTTIRPLNRHGFYDRLITPYNKNGKELITAQEKFRDICNFFGVEALYVKYSVPAGTLLIQNCDTRIPIFHLEEFKCHEFEGAYQCPEDKVNFFSQ